VTALTDRATQVARLDVTSARTVARHTGATLVAVVGAAVERAADRWACAPVAFRDAAGGTRAIDGSHVEVEFGAPRPVVVRGADVTPALRAVADVAAHGAVTAAELRVLLELVAAELTTLTAGPSADDRGAAR
jgi:hypothetical protein